LRTNGKEMPRLSKWTVRVMENKKIEVYNGSSRREIP